MLYIDVDAVCKLAHWNILPLLSDLMKCNWNEMATLSSLFYRASRAVDRPDGKLFRTSAAAIIACDCIAKMALPPEPDAEILVALSESQQIDTGEAVLLAITAGDPKGSFLTGDKRALRALSTLSCSDRFVGRILLVEQILERCLEAKGRDWVLQHVCPFKEIDKTISMILGSRCDGSCESISEGIRSYVGEIARLRKPSLIAG